MKMMVEAYYASFKPVIPLLRPTNGHFVFRFIIFTKRIFSRNVYRSKEMDTKAFLNISFFLQNYTRKMLRPFDPRILLSGVTP